MIQGDPLEIEPLSAVIGAEIRGLDLREPLSEPRFKALHAALLEHQVLFFRDQPLSDDEHLALARRFGDLTVYPVLRILGGDRALEFVEDNAESPPKAEFWHTDITWLRVPPKIGILSARQIPAAGGDTMWASLTAAYDRLSGPMQSLLSDLSGHHDVDDHFFAQVEKALGEELTRKVRAELEGGADHPLVTTHPETKARVLFFSGVFFRSIRGLSPNESQALIEFLWRHVDRPDLSVRWRWRVDDLAIWDERCTVHRALGDHFPAVRVMRRCTVDAEQPPRA